MRKLGPTVKDGESKKKLMDKTNEFVKDKIGQVENLDEDDMKTLFMVIKSLNDKGKKYDIVR
jgi:hypothetical protein